MFINPKYVLKLTTSAAVTVDVVVAYVDLGVNRDQKPASVPTLISTATNLAGLISGLPGQASGWRWQSPSP